MLRRAARIQAQEQEYFEARSTCWRLTMNTRALAHQPAPDANDEHHRCYAGVRPANHKRHTDSHLLDSQQPVEVPGAPRAPQSPSVHELQHPQRSIGQPLHRFAIPKACWVLRVYMLQALLHRTNLIRQRLYLNAGATIAIPRKPARQFKSTNFELSMRKLNAHSSKVLSNTGVSNSGIIQLNGCRQVLALARAKK